MEKTESGLVQNKQNQKYLWKEAGHTPIPAQLTKVWLSKSVPFPGPQFPHRYNEEVGRFGYHGPSHTSKAGTGCQLAGSPTIYKL